MTTDTQSRRNRSPLGKGLGAIIPSKPGTSAVDANGLRNVELSRIRRAPSQPRRKFDDASLDELANSIKQSGLIQPIVVREYGDELEIIAGERRWRACQRAGIEEVPVIVRELSDADAFATALVENIQREDLNPMEEALAYQRLLDEFGHTQQSVAEAVGKSRSAVANAVRLLKLPRSVQDHVSNGDLSAGHARSLVSLDAEYAAELAELMVLHDYSVREAEELARQAKQAPQPKNESSSRFRDDAQVRKVALELQSALGTLVKVKDRHGKGHIEIHYADYDVLQGVLDRLLGE